MNTQLSKSKEYVKEYNKQYYQNNKHKCVEWREANRDKRRESDARVRAKNPKRSTKYYKEHPWLNSYLNALQRCTNPKSNNYRWYGAKGIKMLMTPAQFKTLWFRDKAHDMKSPTIDRVDNKGNYVFDNCRYLERSENTRRRYDKAM